MKSKGFLRLSATYNNSLTMYLGTKKLFPTFAPAMKDKIINIAILIACVLVWGTSFLLIKKGLAVFTFDEVAAIRVGVAFIATLPILLYNFRKIPRETWKFLLMVGLMGNGIPALLFPFAQQHIESHLAGVLNSLTPVFVLILGVLLFKQKNDPRKYIGIGLGFVGAVMLMQFTAHPTASDGMVIDNRYAWFCVLATVCYGISTNTIKSYLQDVDATHAMAGSLLFVGLPFLIYLFSCTDVVHTVQTNPDAWKAVGYLTILAVMSTVVASILYIVLLQRTTAVFGSTTTYIMPIVSLAWGWMDGESLQPIVFLCLALILVGVWLTAKSKG